MKNKYYLDNSILYGTKTQDYQIILEAKISVSSNAKGFFSELEKLEEKSKKVTLSKPLTNFKNLKEKILTIKKNNEFKTIAKAPNNDDFLFQERVSELQVIEQLLLLLEKEPLKEISHKIKDFIEKNKNKEERLLKSLENEILETKNILLPLNSHIKNLKERNILTLQEKIKEEEQKEKEINVKKTQFEEQLKEEHKQSKFQIKKDTLVQKLEKIEYQIKDSQLAIEEFKTKIQILNDEQKLGKEKKVPLSSLIFTLGLSYLTDYYDIPNIKTRLLYSIQKKKEKILGLTRKKLKFENFLSVTEKELKKQAVKVVKVQETITKNIIEIETELKRIEKTVKELEKKSKEEQLKIEPFLKQKETVENKLVELSSQFNSLKKYSTTNLKKNLEKIKNEQNILYNKLKEHKSKIEKQKLPIKGSYIITI